MKDRGLHHIKKFLNGVMLHVLAEMTWCNLAIINSSLGFEKLKQQLPLAFIYSHVFNFKAAGINP